MSIVLLALWLDLLLSLVPSVFHMNMRKLPLEKKALCICSKYFRKISAATQTRCKVKELLDVTGVKFFLLMQANKMFST